MGDSLLDFFNKNNIKNKIKNEYALWYKNKKYVQVGAGENYILNKKLNNYDDLSIVLRPEDITYKIYSIGGRIFCEDINICKLKKNEIVKELKEFFLDKVTTLIDNTDHPADSTGDSKTYTTFFNFKNSEAYVEVSVYDWSDKMSKEENYPDNLKIVIIGEEFRKFLTNEQYN